MEQQGTSYKEKVEPIFPFNFQSEGELKRYREAVERFQPERLARSVSQILCADLYANKVLSVTS